MTDTSSAMPDLTACDREPITRLECIQSFGFLLAMSKDWIVARASANLEAFLGIDSGAALGATLDVLIDVETLHDIRNRMAFLRGASGIERFYKKTLIAGRAPFDIAVHYSESLFILEGEPHCLTDEMDAASLVRSMMTRLSKRTTFETFYRDAARQIRVMTAFERVMIYRFAESGAGEVIAESLANGMESFLGLHYPASDIPVQARALYLRNPFRIIADVSAPPVALLPAAASAVQPLDLSLAMTRAVSPVHIEYLSNMGIGASLSISIIIDGALWGLIACHNRTPRLPDYCRRTAAELFGQIFSLTLESWLKQAQIDADGNLRASVDQMSMAIAGNGALLANAAWLLDTMCGMIPCDGLSTLMGGALNSSGSVPSNPDIEAIAHRLNIAPPARVFATDHLGALVPEAGGHADVAAGVLVLPISRTPRDYIFLFRRERQYAVQWAGDPTKPVVSSEKGSRLAPRASFKAFSESVRGHSLPFTARERRTAELLRSALIDVVLHRSSATEESQRKLFERQELLIAELNHRVRNILALIRGLISQTDGSHGDVSTYVESLGGRIQSIARAHDQITKQNWGPGKLTTLLEGEIAAYIPERKDRFTLTGPTVWLQPAAFSTLSLVIHELVTNSAKYGSLSDNGRVVVTLERPSGHGLYLKWREIEGPVVEEPRRRGFGSVIVERVIPFDLQGTSEVRYRPSGLEADFFIPEMHIASIVPESPAQLLGGPPDTAAVPGGSGHNTPLNGCTVLLLEDNMIIALEAEELLRELGAASVLCVSTVIGAEEILKTERLDFALLDINLGPSTSLGFSELLRAAAIPFIFASGYGESVTLSAVTAGMPAVTKPFTRRTLEMAIAQCRPQFRA